MNIWIYHNFNGDYNFLFMALIIPNWKLYLMFYTFLEHNNYFLMALWFSLHGIALDCCEDVLFVLFSVITQWQWWRELMTVINLWQHSSAAIFSVAKTTCSLHWPKSSGFYFLCDLWSFSFWPLFQGFFLWPLCSHCHRVSFYWTWFFKVKTDATKTMTNLWSLLYDFSMTNLWSLIYDFLMTNLWSLLYDFFMTNLWSLIMWLAQLDDQRLVTRWTFLIDVQWSIFSFSVAKATLNNNLWHIYFSDAIMCVHSVVWC